MKQIYIDVNPAGQVQTEAANSVKGVSCESVVKAISDLVAPGQEISTEIKPEYYEQDVSTSVDVVQ